MSVRVVARIRPLLKSEIEKDAIVHASSTDTDSPLNTVTIPNPKNSAENFSFQFNSVYDDNATQQQIFDNEVSPTVKHLFNGFDVTMFAYGVTGTGKTHTMRGGKTLAERGVIPRLLSSIYRRARKIEKDSDGDKKVEVVMSYYEIYNDKVFDLFEPPEKRTAAGLPIRDNNGKTVVSGLTERPCTTLKEFETLYDQANVNRSTSATKLNAHSSRSHAILCVKVSQITEDQTIVSTASAIDLAGSEDNRRTENGKERLVESSSINKSLFVLAQCVEAISKKQSRIPYRESKMTRILSIGQNNGLTVMILNLAPVKSYHLDTLSSLNFANRTKKVEVREVENEPIFKGPAKHSMSATGPSIQRQPLKPLPSAINVGLKPLSTTKPAKSFAVYTEQSRTSLQSAIRREGSLKRGSDALSSSTRPNKIVRPNDSLRAPAQGLSRENLEELVNKMVDEKLANRALKDQENGAAAPALSDELQRRLDALEQRVEKKEDARAEGLQYLLMAKQHQVRGEDVSALKMYRLALPYFPDNEKLGQKMLALQEKIQHKRDDMHSLETHAVNPAVQGPPGALNLTRVNLTAPRSIKRRPLPDHNDEVDESYIDDAASAYSSDAETSSYKSRNNLTAASRKPRPTATKFKVSLTAPSPADNGIGADGETTPRTAHLLRVVNSRDLAQIRSLKGVGAKKAEAIVSRLCEMDDNAEIHALEELGDVRGVGSRAVEVMRAGVLV